MFANIFLIYVGVLTLCLKQNIHKFDAFENRLHNAVSFSNHCYYSHLIFYAQRNLVRETILNYNLESYMTQFARKKKEPVISIAIIFQPVSFARTKRYADVKCRWILAQETLSQ